jgi:hypothetical protein
VDNFSGIYVDNVDKPVHNCIIMFHKGQMLIIPDIKAFVFVLSDYANKWSAVKQYQINPQTPLPFKCFIFH